MIEKKIGSYLGFATKARQLVTGYNTCVYMMEKRKIKLVVLAEDLSENSKEKIMKECNKHHVEYRTYSNIQDLSQITGNENKGIFGITDSNFSKVIVKEIDVVKSTKEAN